MPIIDNYQHRVSSHCETGSLRNILAYEGFKISEPMAFGIGSGVVFAHLFFTRGPSGFPVSALRFPMGAVFKNASKRLGIDIFQKKLKSPEAALEKANQLIDEGKPCAACVDMFYMKYLPKLMRIHVPLHFITLIGREKDFYYVSDPYYNEIGKLSVEDLKLAWETHSLMSSDNLLVYIKDSPSDDQIDWKRAIKKSINFTTVNMLLQPGIRELLPIFGVNGIKTFAKSILSWPEKYKGLVLREGMLGTANIFEEQGTGGGAFRMLYSAFLQEAAGVFNSDGLKEIALRMMENGHAWRDASRTLIRVAKPIPIKRKDYESWISDNNNKESLYEGIAESSRLFSERGDAEKIIFTDLKKVVKTLK